uniref:ATP-dependent Clp protease proteolytic subunit n=1 Tax=Greslania sp. McPherson 19217 TaxID=1542496 RepID=A0A0F6NNX4_9POAL|nr:ATP-dependent Clp protease proteolytic subunit [Greslania sp. McPherson 19217]AIM53305.1 ATP-dependent Clp protease proteolytic subunit [Greslania sp. McPherson 19217]
MPIGVPKVPYRIPGDEDATWVDLYNVMYRERTLFLGEEIRCEITNHITGLMVYLGIEDGTRDIFLFINSPGGWIISGMAIFDTMQTVTPDIYTISLGMSASMASFILMGGEPSKRIAYPHARIMLHQPASSYYRARAQDFFLEVEELHKVREMITRVYALRTGKPFWVVSEDMERDIFMSADEAKAYGLVDIVGDEMMDEHFDTDEVWFPPEFWEDW